MERMNRSYRCQKADGSGHVYVDEYQEFIDITTHGDTTRRYAPGLKRLELRDGGAVNFIDDRTFEVVATGERLAIE